jgi:methionyl-tRNA formyltransferase
LRVAFAGTPAFAARALEALAAAGFQIPLVFTQPDRPAGRGLKLSPSAVALSASRLGLPTHKPESLRGRDALEALRAARPDVMVVAAYGQILPRAVLDTPARGCLNIHASLLPRWRGAAPIHRAILAGDAVTGVTIMRMEEGLDTGPTLLQQTVAIDRGDTTGSLTDKLAIAGASAMVAALRGLDCLEERAQDASRASYAAKISKSETAIDWSQPCEAIDRQVRAFNPSPGAEATLGGEKIKIWLAAPITSVEGMPGSLVSVDAGNVVVACGSGALRLDLVQRPGGRRMPASDFLRGSSAGVGAHRNC